MHEIYTEWNTDLFIWVVESSRWRTNCITQSCLSSIFQASIDYQYSAQTNFLLVCFAVLLFWLAVNRTRKIYFIAMVFLFYFTAVQPCGFVVVQCLEVICIIYAAWLISFTVHTCLFYSLHLWESQNKIWYFTVCETLDALHCKTHTYL